MLLEERPTFLPSSTTNSPVCSFLTSFRSEDIRQTRWQLKQPQQKSLASSAVWTSTSSRHPASRRNGAASSATTDLLNFDINSRGDQARPRRRQRQRQRCRVRRRGSRGGCHSRYRCRQKEEEEKAQKEEEGPD